MEFYLFIINVIIILYIVIRSCKLKEEIYVLKKQESFDLDDIFECGQCFRWNKNEDGSYTGVIKSGVLNI